MKEAFRNPSETTDSDGDCDFAHAKPFHAVSHGHELMFMPGGAHRFDTLIDLIEGAQESLKLFYYMFQDDAAGEVVRETLIKAARRGVDVQLIVDRFGTDAGEAFFRPFQAAGGRFVIFNPRWGRRYLIRNHQKMAIADDQTAIVGGFNISEHYFKPPDENGWCDLGVMIKGPVVDRLVEWYAKIAQWANSSDQRYRAARSMVRDWEPGDGAARLLVGGPTAVPSNWARQVKKDLRKASRLDLVMAYFSPPRSFRRLIRRIGKRGQARLVMAGKTDNPATVGAARATYGSLLRKGAQIYEFQPCKLHMKLLVIDDAVYFGSANFDHRSIRLNLELMFRFEDADLAKKLRGFVDSLVDASEQVTYDLHCKRRGLFSLLRWWAGWFLVTTLDYTITRRLNAGN